MTVTGQRRRPISKTDDRVSFWYQCKQECIRLTWACESPCRNYAETRMAYKMCALECKLDRLVCYDQCREFIAQGLVWLASPSNNNKRNRRRMDGEENEYEGPTSMSNRKDFMAFLNYILES